MCFSATANFVGSGVLGAVGVVTLTKVKHRRELLFAALPVLFAIHQFIEGFVWLGLDKILSPTVAHDMGAAFMLYAQGLLPFLLPMSVYLFEPDKKEPGTHAAIRRARRRNDALHTLGIDGLSVTAIRQERQYRVHQSSHEQHGGRRALRDCHLRLAIFLENKNDGSLRRGKPGDSSGGNGIQALCLHVPLVRVRGNRKRNHPPLLLEKQRGATVPVRLSNIGNGSH
jgi:hypothetical protein